MLNARTIRYLIAAVSVGGLVAAPSVAAAKKQHKFVGGHPGHSDDNSYCHIEAPHVHVYAPAHGNKKKIKLQYRIADGHYHFIGDPVGHGYDGPRHNYYGHHPVALDVVAGVHVESEPHDIAYCYLNGPHFHAYAPPPDIEFTVKGDAYWYVGAYPSSYKENRRALVQINAIYEPIVYQRPVIEVEPPELYVGPVVDVHAHAHAGGHAEVRTGVEVDVHIPAPTLEVEVGLPGIVVVDGHHDHGHKRKYKKHKRHKRSKSVWTKTTKRKKHKKHKKSKSVWR
jgi:hypothetical protein